MSTQQRGEETRIRILDTAGECFARDGYDATSVAQICQQAGVTKGAFYHHFPSKQAVFMELLERWLTGLDVQLTTTLDNAPSVPQGLLQMADMAQHVFKMAGGQVPMFLEFMTKAVHDQEVWQATIDPYRRYQTYFAKIIEAGIDEGSLQVVDPDMAARIVVSLAVGLVLQSALDAKGSDWGRVAREGIRLLLEGMEKK